MAPVFYQGRVHTLGGAAVSSSVGRWGQGCTEQNRQQALAHAAAGRKPRVDQGGSKEGMPLPRADRN